MGKVGTIYLMTLPSVCANHELDPSDEELRTWISVAIVCLVLAEHSNLVGPANRKGLRLAGVVKVLRLVPRAGYGCVELLTGMGGVMDMFGEQGEE